MNPRGCAPSGTALTRKNARRLRNLAEATNQAREDAERNVGAFDRLKGAVIAFGAALGVAFVAGKIKDFFDEAVSGAANFEAQLSTVKAVSGASAEEMEALRAAAEKMGAETKYNATEAAQALENLARAGLKSSEAIEALPSVLALAQGNGLELADAASHITQTASGMGLAMSYAAPNAHALGLTLEETAAYIGKLADAGFDGSRAGTAIATMMSQFQNPASTFRRELASISIRTNNFSQAIRELAATGPKGQAAISALGEAVTTVAEVWLETLTRWDWQAADVARIEYTFRRLCAEMTDWPAPRHFLDRLPPRPSLPPPDTIHDPVETAKNAALFDQIAQMLKMENTHEHRTETEQTRSQDRRQPNRHLG